MRRLGAAMLVVALLWPGASQADVGAFAGAEQLAEADWLDLKAKRFYFAMGTRSLSPDGAQTIGYVGRGTCEVHRSKNFTLVACSGFGRGKELTLDEFQIDPALSSASMTMKSGGHTHSVQWTGEDVPVAGTQASGSGFGFQMGAGAARNAPASGELFGVKLEPRGRTSFGALAQGGYAVVYNEGRSVELLDDGRVRMLVEYRIPR